MAPNDLLETIRVAPFQPFRLWLSDGTHHDVYSPDLIMVGVASVILGLTKFAGDELFERTIRLDVRHITKIEPLPATAPPASDQGNGQQLGG